MTALEAPLLFLHGNCSSSRFWEALLGRLPPGYRAVAPDMRGFGANSRPIDARRGLKDLADDAEEAAAEAFGARPVQVIGHSVGGGVALQLALSYPERVRSLVLVAPMSPYGFGGTRDAAGTPCSGDYAGSGAGTASPDFVARVAMADRSLDAPSSPRRVLREFFFHPPFLPAAELEEALVDGILSTRVGNEHYPGDVVRTATWPGFAPGVTGMNNALSPKWCDLSAFGKVRARPPVLWIRGAEDTIVSDRSLFCPGTLGAAGLIDGWPGADVFPPQPMLAQIRSVLAKGDTREEVMAGVGHTPFVEDPGGFLARVLPFLGDHR